MKVGMRTLFVLLFTIVSTLQIIAQGGLNWTADGSGYYAIQSGEIVQVTLPAQLKTVLFDKKSLTPAGSSNSLTPASFRYSEDKTNLLLFTNTKKVWRYNTRGDYWVMNTSTRQLRKLGKTLPEASLMFAKFSPDGKRVAYVSNYNIYVEEVESGQIRQLTTDGNRKLINGTFDWVYEEEFNARDGFRWSPDSRQIAFWQIDARNTKDYLMVNNTDSLYPFVVPVEYPISGEPPSPFKIGVIEVNSGSLKWMNLPTDPILGSYVPAMDWAGNSNQLLVQHLNRKQNELQLIISDVKTGDPTVIYKENDAAWIDIHTSLDGNATNGGWDWLAGGKEFLWTSEKDGWRHLYRISRDGKKSTLVTKGNFDVIDLVAIDEKAGFVYFMASPDNATQSYLYRAKLDGKSAPQRISPAHQRGTHSYDIAPGGRFAVHSFSNHYTNGGREFITLADHKAVMGESKIDAAVKAADSAKATVSFFKVKTPEGVEMDGWMTKPRNFDPSKKYPVVFYVYTEPAGANVKDRFGVGRNALYAGDMQADGYIYMSIDNRGTPVPKGREWRKSVYRKIGLVNIADQAAAAREILKWPFVDSSRIAVWGWSGGGSATLNLMFQYPEIYKTGISVAAVGNQRTYDNIYQERYMGLPQENPEDFEKGSPITYAKNLKGNLLYIHGTGDDNVHWNNAEMLINELVKYNRQFQLMAYPNRTHGISEGEGTGAHLSTLYTNYLRTYCPPGGR
ncbi:MAG: S9 family peptidase [Chitinophagaceae bacterium]|nr:MAG: S9 family peptidase [Chitinophagaceae bacterium]